MKPAFTLAAVMAVALLMAPGAAAQQPETVPRGAPSTLDPSPHQPHTAPPTVTPGHTPTAPITDADTRSEAVRLQEAHAGCPCPMCPMKNDAAAGAVADLEHPDRRVMYFRDTRLSTTDPAFILAMADELNLTEEQRQRIHQIQREKRSEVREVLTDAQERELAGLPSDEFTLRNLHDDMMAGRTSAGDPRSPAGDPLPHPGPERTPAEREQQN